MGEQKQQDNDKCSVRIRLDARSRRRLRRLSAELNCPYGDVVSRSLKAMEQQATGESPAA